MFQNLKQSTVDRCMTLGWVAEASLYMEPMKEVEDRLTFAEADVRGITVLSDEGLSQDEISKYLRIYRRVLRAPPEKITPDAVRTIDRNLLWMARRDLNRRNWGDWTDVVTTLGYKRASPDMRSFVTGKVEEKGSEKSKALSRAAKAFAQVAAMSKGDQRN